MSNNNYQVPPWAVRARMKAFSVIVQRKDIFPLFHCGNSWWSISSPQSRSVTNLTKTSGEVITVLTLMEQIGCSENDMIEAFGPRWVNQILKELSFSRSRKFYLAKLVTVSSIDYDEIIEKMTPHWKSFWCG